MKAAKTWCLAGLVFMAGVSSASCGKDEGTGGGHGDVLGGSGGGGGTGGSLGRGGGGGNTSAASKLGQACVNDKQCEDTAAPGLTCITATDTALGDGAPPKGLCTAVCSSDDECATFSAGSLCYPFVDGADTGYCVEGCSFGAADVGEMKCHDRPEFACNPALLGKTQTSCDASADCQEGEICFDGVCNVVFPACLPACRGDIDCADGTFCDQSFLSGVCVKDKPKGKTLGEPCTVPADDEPNEPDECLGFCQADEADSNQGHCSNSCAFATECSWNATTEKFDGVCFYGSALAPRPGAGDFGFCTPTCNCSSECQDAALGCSLLEQGPLNDDFRGPGLCFAPDETTVEYNQCADSVGGAGGAGGADSIGTGGVPTDAGGAGGQP